jgi:hypothetical protein
MTEIDFGAELILDTEPESRANGLALHPGLSVQSLSTMVP